MSLNPNFANALAAFQRGDLDQAHSLAVDCATTFQSPELDHLLGLIHCRRGDLQAGLDHLRSAAEAEPENAGYRLFLVRALVDCGRTNEALALPKPDQSGTPASLALWHARAEAADIGGETQSAKEAWQMIAAARPLDWRAWNNLGNAMAALLEWDQALHALGRAAELNPREAAVRRNLALALSNMKQFEESIEQLNDAVRLDPNHLESQLTLARLLADLGRHEEALAQLDYSARSAPGSSEIAIARGRSLVAIIAFEEAEQAYLAAIAASPADRSAIHELGLLFERTNRMDALNDLLGRAIGAGLGPEQLGYLAAAAALREGRAEEARLLLLNESPESDPIRWHRLMARIADALGEPEAAFAAAAAMNKATVGYDEWRHRGLEYRDRLRKLGPLITQEWAGRLPQLPPSGRRSPAFLVGFPRSGTTLLDTFLMGHPETLVLEEVHMLGAAELVVGKLPDLPDCSVSVMEEARQAYFAELDRHVDQDFAGLVVDKLPLNMIGFPLIRCLFPEAPVIFAQRHPCDAVLSGFMQSFILNEAMACFLDLADGADLYDAAMEVWARSRQVLPSGVRTLIYEELIADPELALKPLVDFLGLEWREELLDHRSTAKRRGAILTPSYDQVTQALDSRPSGRWRRYQKWMEPVLPTLLPWADSLGYSR